MISESRAGRPRASSRETLAEAACELFLEQGYEATTVADITRRAGVSRSSFFNYFSSKNDVLWSGLDERIDAFEARLAGGAEIDASLREIAVDLIPDALALAIMNAAAMGFDDELDRECAVRAARIARAIAVRLEASGIDPLAADVRGGAGGSAVLAAIRAWAARGPGTESLATLLDRALAIVGGLAGE